MLKDVINRYRPNRIRLLANATIIDPSDKAKTDLAVSYDKVNGRPIATLTNGDRLPIIVKL